MTPAKITIEISSISETYWASAEGFEGVIARSTKAELLKVLDWCFSETGYEIITTRIV